MPFHLPTKVVIEPGSLDRLGSHLNQFPAERALLMFDEGLSGTVWPGRVIAQLNDAGIAVVEFDAVEENPRVETVDQASNVARSADVELIVGIGGGSVLDAAKAVSMLARNRGGCTKYEGKNLFSEPSTPFIAIPTTCGTGSEVTWVSVISDPSTRRKISIKGNGMFPSVALVDADVLETLPVRLIAETGIDALTHALEAMTGRYANPISDVLARESVHLLLENLASLVENRGNTAARERVMRAATLAGIAFGNSDVAAVHCLSESIGGLLDLAHGLLNAILLVPVLHYQFDSISDRLAEISPKYSAPDLLREIELLIDTIRIPSFASLDISAEMFDLIAEMAERNGSNASNLREMKMRDYRKILDQLAG